MKNLGLDPGTGNLLVASDDGVIIERNAFISIEPQATTKRQLKRMGVPYIEIEGSLHLVGKHAFEYANIFNTAELRRPMRDGLINPVETDALPIMKHMIGSLLPKGDKARVVYSVPANPIDAERDNQYHADVIGQILDHYGFENHPINEAFALGNAGLEDHNLTGIAISFGAGMANVAILYRGMSAIQFSVSKSGDWVSNNIAKDTGISVAKANLIKEKGDYSISPDAKNLTREQNASRSYYQALIRYILSNIAHQFNEAAEVPTFSEPVPIVCGGGTAMVNGFIDAFKDQFTQTDFPIEVNDIILVDEPLTAVARGCLIEAQLMEDE